jgi:glycosyltransferase involved in cell wall biosynthesis
MSAPALRSYDRVAVVIPAHNERASLPACLRAVLTASLCVPLPVVTIVVLDACDDGSSELAGDYGPDVHFVQIDANNVGSARAAGFRYAQSLYPSDTKCWYATTDADSRVDPNWLVQQLDVRADMVLGVVRVADWQEHPAELADRYEQKYRAGESDGSHDHVHGANMGFRAHAYWRVGGFRPLATGEDADLVARFEDTGYRIHRDGDLTVVTSARSEGRAPRGFAHLLNTLDEAVAGECA